MKFIKILVFKELFMQMPRSKLQPVVNMYCKYIGHSTNAPQKRIRMLALQPHSPPPLKATRLIVGT